MIILDKDKCPTTLSVEEEYPLFFVKRNPLIDKFIELLEEKEKDEKMKKKLYEEGPNKYLPNNDYCKF